MEEKLKMELSDDNYTEEVLDKSTYLYRKTDKDGNTMKYRLYGGHKYMEASPGNCPEMLDAIANMKCREDDILLATYPKSGLHWITNIVRMLVSGTTEYEGTPRFLEFDANIDKHEKGNSPRVTSTHVHFDLLPREILHGGKGKIINISRNPKDVAVSLYSFLKKLPSDLAYNGDFNGFLKFYLREDITLDGWFEYYKKMLEVSKGIPKKSILMIRYETMKRDLYGHIHRISEFLGVQRSDEFIREVEERCSFSSMQIATYKPSEHFNVVLPIYRKGTIGDWKNWFTVAQNELFDAVYSEKMSELHVKFDFC